jgi:DNA-directed RNA polymerase subunit RPC12/RpoP
MEKSLGSLKLSENYFSENSSSFRCNGCSGTFPKPIIATVLSHGGVQTYYACPRCLSKIDDVEHHKNEEGKGNAITIGKAKKAILAKSEDDAKCSHFLGYLKKRPKNMSIPDECLTCDKMIECLFQ